MNSQERGLPDLKEVSAHRNSLLILKDKGQEQKKNFYRFSLEYIRQIPY